MKIGKSAHYFNRFGVLSERFGTGGAMDFSSKAGPPTLRTHIFHNISQHEIAFLSFVD
jgi:hypothetical protein